jgi:hypothetical protein
MPSVTAGPSRQAQPSVSNQISYTLDQIDPNDLRQDLRICTCGARAVPRAVLGCVEAIARSAPLSAAAATRHPTPQVPEEYAHPKITSDVLRAENAVCPVRVNVALFG